MARNSTRNCWPRKMMAEREELLKYIRLGYTNQEIADLTGLSPRTLKNRRKQYGIRKKDICSIISGMDDAKIQLQKSLTYLLVLLLLVVG